ncbi:MAG TPA: hypothetical protein VF405_11615, partial [Gammaproteobacteria bacterium]
KYDAPERIGVAGDLGGIVGILADARVQVILIGGLAAQDCDLQREFSTFRLITAVAARPIHVLS